MPSKRIAKARFRQAATKSPPPSWFGSVPSGVNRWKLTAPLITSSPASAPAACRCPRRGDMPAISRVAASSSIEPITYWEKRPV
jgi:hypothetical protein